MKLSTEELAWVDGNLATYKIKYQEVYDELKDHILTAIETLRAAGDKREIDVLFNEVVQQQFPGYWPFEDIVNQSRLAYNRKIWQAMWANYKHYFNWETIPMMILLLAASFYLPQTKPVFVTMLCLLLIVSITPVVYVYIKSRTIKTDKGKHSLVKANLLQCANLMVIVFNFLINSVGMLAREWEPASFLNPKHFPPVVYVLLIILAFVYFLSCMRLSRQEFKIAG